MKPSSSTAWEHHVDTKFMDEMHPINTLSRKARAQLFKKAHFDKIQRGTILSAPDERHWLIYVMQGKLVESGTHGNGQEGNGQPLFANNPAGTARATQDCVIVRFDRKLYELLLQKDEQSHYQVESIEISQTEGELFDQILQEYRADGIELPGLPEIAVKIRKAVGDPDASTGQVVRLVETDPALTAKLIKVANSARFLGTKPVRSTQDAVTKIGLHAVQQLATSHAVLGIFSGTSTAVRGIVKGLFEHSLRIGTLSYYVAKTRTRLDPDGALLAGIVHDIGAIPLLAHIAKLGLSLESAEVEHVLRKLRRVIGGLVLSKWGFEGDFIKVAEEIDQWSRYSDAAIDYCDVVMVAHWCAHALGQDDVDTPDRSDIPAFRKIGMEYMTLDEIHELLDDAQSELAELQALMS